MEGDYGGGGASGYWGDDIEPQGNQLNTMQPQSNMLNQGGTMQPMMNQNPMMGQGSMGQMGDSQMSVKGDICEMFPYLPHCIVRRMNGNS